LGSQNPTGPIEKESLALASREAPSRVHKPRRKQPKEEEIARRSSEEDFRRSLKNPGLN